LDSPLRPLTTSQVLDRTFQLYRRNFVLFAGIALPAALLTLATKFIPNEEAAGFVVSAIVALVVAMIGEAIASGATAVAVSAVHLNKQITIVESYRMLKASFAAILGVVVFVGLRALGSLMLAALPGFILAFIPIVGAILSAFLLLGAFCWTYCKYALAVPACAIERLSAKQSLSRSRDLTDGIIKQVVIIFVLAWVIESSVSELLKAPVTLLPRLGYALPFAKASKAVWENAAVFLSALLTNPISTIAFSILYYDQRVRREAFDLDLMINSLEQKHAPAQAEGHSGSH
jgi:hypothetical protein